MLFLVVMILLFFFFSSRRRHTRSKRDWSSDVCSSDLEFSLCLFSLALPMEEDSEVIVSLGVFRIQSESTLVGLPGIQSVTFGEIEVSRSEERRVGKECRCRRWGEQ